jgi:sulfhydrogenase subunit alpha
VWIARASGAVHDVTDAITAHQEGSHMPAVTSSDICVGYATHPEGEGGLELVVTMDETPCLRIPLFTSPHVARLALAGKPFHAVPAAVAGACAQQGVCHQVAAVEALEAAFGIEATPLMKAHRRLLLLAQWIQGHALHIHFLAAPGLLGHSSSFALASAHPEVVQRALRLKKLGADLTGIVGGRRAAPLPLRTGGTPPLPSRSAIDRVLRRLERGRVDALESVALVSAMRIPPLSLPSEQVAVREEGDYPVHAGRVTSTAGLNLPVSHYHQEVQRRALVAGNPLTCHARGPTPLLVGPLARLNLNQDRLSTTASQALRSCGLSLPSHNPLASVVARAVELVHAVEECTRMLDHLEWRDEEVRYEVTAGEGAAAVESPRGLLYHRYHVDAVGVVRRAVIVSPASHNVLNLEAALRAVASRGTEEPGDPLKMRLAMVARSYDPCATCSRNVAGLGFCLDA